MRPAVALVSVLMLAAAPAAASEVAKPPKDADRNLDLSLVGLPIVWNGKLVNYVFVTARLKLAPGQALEKLRAKEPYYRDALVRAAARTPFVDPHDLTRVDERALDSALLREAARIAGPRVFVAAEVLSQQPRQRVGMPHTGQETPRGRSIVP